MQVRLLPITGGIVFSSLPNQRAGRRSSIIDQTRSVLRHCPVVRALERHTSSARSSRALRQSVGDLLSVAHSRLRVDADGLSGPWPGLDPTRLSITPTHPKALHSPA